MPQYDDDDFDFEDDTNLQGTDLVKSLRKQLSAAQKQLKVREQELMEYQQVTHEQTVASMLQSYGLSPRIARYVSDDVTTEDDLIEWLDVYGEDFGIAPAEENYEMDSDAQASELMYEVEDGAYDPEVGYDLANRIESASTPEELLRILGQAQA
jgi:hypothetical protein